MEPSPCYVQWTTTWLTNSSWHLLRSHEAVENFYLRSENNGMRQCEEKYRSVVCSPKKNGTLPEVKMIEVEEEMFIKLVEQYQNNLLTIHRLRKEIAKQTKIIANQTNESTPN